MAPPTARMTARTAPPDGAALYAARCSSCHDHAVDWIPPKVYISTRRGEDEIIDALTCGVMRARAAGLRDPQIRAIAVYLTGQEPSDRRLDPAANRCSGSWRLSRRLVACDRATEAANITIVVACCPQKSRSRSASYCEEIFMMQSTKD
jgi:hypothetical protein